MAVTIAQLQAKLNAVKELTANYSDKFALCSSIACLAAITEIPFSIDDPLMVTSLLSILSSIGRVNHALRGTEHFLNQMQDEINLLALNPDQQLADHIQFRLDIQKDNIQCANTHFMAPMNTISMLGGCVFLGYRGNDIARLAAKAVYRTFGPK
ncbi:MAG: hypothetical protein ACHQAX_08095 [Gammaproteobacteria bacterium]